MAENKPENTPEIPEASKLTELGEKLLLRTHEYCDGAFSQQEIIKTQIDKIIDRLNRTIDPNEIAKLTTAIKTLQEVNASLHDRSIIGFMAHYTPLQNLIDSRKSSGEPKETPKETKENITINKSLEIIDSDINEIYKKYED